MTSSKPEHLRRAPLPMPPQWEAGLQHRNLGGCRHSLHNGAHACMPDCVCIRAWACTCLYVCTPVCVCVCSAGLLPPLSPPDFPSAMASCPLHTGVCSSALVQPKHSLTITPLVGLWTVNGHKAQGTPEPSGGFHSLPASLPINLSASPPENP